MNLSMPSDQKDLFLGQTGGLKPVVLEIKGQVIPSFKNNKMLITKKPNGQPLREPMLITRPDLQKRMAKITESFVSQLRCAFRTESGEILTGCSLQSAIALCVPDDDCWTRLPEITVRSELCAPGEEGATVVIERIG